MTVATVFVVRHGRTPLNAAGVLRGRIDTLLDEVGRAEARALGDVFRDVALATIFSSPLARAQDTAAAIAKSTASHVDLDADLADRDYGEWAGHSLVSVEARFGSLDNAPGVEPLDQFVARVTSALTRAAEHASEAPVVVVAHDAVNRHALAALVGALGRAEDIPQRTGCWNRLERRLDGWSAPIVDAVPHDGRRP
jgi:broad specificity phosphatase PhoE